MAKEMEATIFAAQEQALSVNTIKAQNSMLIKVQAALWMCR